MCRIEDQEKQLQEEKSRVMSDLRAAKQHVPSSVPVYPTNVTDPPGYKSGSPANMVGQTPPSYNTMPPPPHIMTAGNSTGNPAHPVNSAYYRRHSSFHYAPTPHISHYHEPSQNTLLQPTNSYYNLPIGAAPPQGMGMMSHEAPPPMQQMYSLIHNEWGQYRPPSLHHHYPSTSGLPPHHHPGLPPPQGYAPIKEGGVASPGRPDEHESNNVQNR
jgi:hypothetical protein